MKKIFLITAASLFFTGIASAQKNKFGTITYSIPSGYTLIRIDSVLTYHVEDSATGTYCNFSIYTQMPGHGGVQEDFDYCWENLVQKPLKLTETANKLPKANIKGWQFILGQTRFSDEGVATLALQICFSKENTMQNMVILSNSDVYKADIENFIASVDINDEIEGNTSIKHSNKTLDFSFAVLKARKKYLSANVDPINYQSICKSASMEDLCVKNSL